LRIFSDQQSNPDQATAATPRWLYNVREGTVDTSTSHSDWASMITKSDAEPRLSALRRIAHGEVSVGGGLQLADMARRCREGCGREYRQYDSQSGASAELSA